MTENSVINRHTFPLPIEDVWSGIAWRRRKKSGQPHHKTQNRHLKKANRKFANHLRQSIIKEAEEAIRSGLSVIGVTQLHWSAGAAEVFQEMDIPYLVFVRDELKSIQSDLVLVAIGVKPNVENIGLEKLNINYSKDGINTNKYMQTNVESIYAIGDVAGPPMLAHKASAEGIIAVESIAGKETKSINLYDYVIINISVFFAG